MPQDGTLFSEHPAFWQQMNRRNSSGSQVVMAIQHAPEWKITVTRSLKLHLTTSGIVVCTLFVIGLIAVATQHVAASAGRNIAGGDVDYCADTVCLNPSRHLKQTEDVNPAQGIDELPVQISSTRLPPQRVRRPDLASLGIREMIRDYDNARLAPVFHGMALAPKLTWRCFMYAAANEPIDEFGNRMLHISARSSNAFYAWCLMESGANPYLTNIDRQTPIQSVLGPSSEMQSRTQLCISAGIHHRMKLPASNVPGNLHDAGTQLAETRFTDDSTSGNAEESEGQQANEKTVPAQFDPATILSLGSRARI